MSSDSNQRKERRFSMAKRSTEEMRTEYDFSQLTGAVRGKYYSRAKAGTNLVLIDPNLAKVFPNSEFKK